MTTSTPLATSTPLTTSNTEAYSAPVGYQVSGIAVHPVPATDESTAGPVSPRGSRFRRHAALSVCAVMISLSSSGCAAAARVLTVVQAVSTVHNMLASLSPSDTSDSGSSTQHAVVSGTGGSGLRLERHPGSGRLSTWPDGSSVTVQCTATGPPVAGPRGATSTWSRVTTADRSRGFMSNAYLTITTDADSMLPC